MLYVFHGSDQNASRKKAQTLIGSLKSKKPDAAYEEITSDSWNTSVLESHLGGQGLFSNKYIIFLNAVTENSEAADELPAFIPSMKESENIFIVLEGKLKADLKKAFAKNADKVVESEASIKEVKKSQFNIFALGEAVGTRDPIRSWTLLRQAVDSGQEMEGVLGTLFWQVKSIMLAQQASSAAEAGLNPFVYSKAKSFTKNYSKEELQTLAANLIILYHDGHRGIVDLELGTERVMLLCAQLDSNQRPSA